MVSNQDELLTKQIPEKLLDSKHNHQSLFLDLTVIPLGLGQNLGNRGDRSLKAIRIAMKECSSYSKTRCITGDPNWKSRVVVGEDRVAGQKTLKPFKRRLLVLPPVPFSILVCKSIKRFRFGCITWR